MVAALVISSALAGWLGLIAGVAALIVALSLTRLAANRLGGITGDVLGALVELSELTFLVTFSLAQTFERFR